MSYLIFTITGCEMNLGPTNYFVQCELIETPGEETKELHPKKTKFRTNVSTNSQYPSFSSNSFKFSEVNIFNKLELKVGIFQTMATDSKYSEALATQSRLVGNNKFPITEELLYRLKNKKLYTSKKNIIKETGVISFIISLKAQFVEQDIYFESEKIQEIYYDPFENDSNVIRSKLAAVIEECSIRQKKLGNFIEMVDQRNLALQKVSTDLKKLRALETDLAKENEEMKKKLFALQDVDEIHIEIDVLTQSPEGLIQLRQRLSNIMERRENERERYMELQKEYFQLKPKLDKSKRVIKYFEELKEAHKLQELHIQRNYDLMFVAENAKSTIKCQEAVIKNLNEAVKESLAKQPSNKREVDHHLEKLRFEREKYKEKKKQLGLLLELHNNKVDKNDLLPFQEFLNYEVDAKNAKENDLGEILRLTIENERLQSEIININAQLNTSMLLNDKGVLQQTAEEIDYQEYQKWVEERPFLLNKYEHLQNNEADMRQNIQKIINERARHLSNLKNQISMLDAQIQILETDGNE